jgi:selenocysteine lyase/cysteine desulfurase
VDIWQSFRQQFPVTDTLLYLNHAAVSPLPLRCKDRMQDYLERLTRHGALDYPALPARAAGRVRELGARLLGTRPERIFVVRSTTQGLGIAATGLPLHDGDNVVLVEKEFPANLRPWMPLGRRGVELRLVPQRDGRVLLDDLARAVDRRTAAVSLSFVQFLSGFRIDLGPVAELCRRHDALLVVDAIQGLGVFPLDVEALGVDLLSADAHKWLLGPEGVGLGYVSERGLERIQPALEGWLSVERPFDFFDLQQPLKPGAARFEEGALNLAGIFGFSGSLELILGAGVEALGQRILALTDHLAERLAARGWSVLSPRARPQEKSGILLLSHPDGRDMDLLNGQLERRGIVVSARDGALRVAPHAYNTFEEMDRLVDELG